MLMIWWNFGRAGIQKKKVLPEIGQSCRYRVHGNQSRFDADRRR